jgi:hypothetical protein
MESGDEYSGDEYSGDEFDFDENREINGYDEEEITKKLENETDNIELKNSILNQKMFLVIRYNRGILDPDIYFSSLNKLNKQLHEIEAYSTSIDNLFVQKEFEFNELIDSYVIKTKNSIELSSTELTELQNAETELNSLREAFLKRQNSKTETPEESLVHEFDSNGFLVNWDAFEEAEMKEMISTAKRLKLKVKIPKRAKYANATDYENAKDKFFKFMIPYIPTYTSKLNVTTYGTTIEREVKVPLMEQVKEDLKEIESSKVILSAKDKKDVFDLKIIREQLMKLDRSQLIDCIMNSNLRKRSLSYIEQLRANKKVFLNYKPYIIKKEYSPRELVTNILLSLGENVSESNSTKELEDILIKKYKIPPNLYYKKNLTYNVNITGSSGKQKELNFKYNAASPLVMAKRFPIPSGIELSNTNYYETYLPVDESLYSVLKGNNSIEELWLIPVKTSAGNYVLKKITVFEEYLLEVKNINLNNITKLEKEITNEKNVVRIANLEQLIETLKDRIYKLDEYIKNKRVIENVGIQKPGVRIPGVSYVTEWQRKVKKGVLLKEFGNNDKIAKELTDALETYIYRQNMENVEGYLDKINNILFIFTTYPEFKDQLLNGEINIYQFATYDRDFLLREQSRNDKPSIKIRIQVLNGIKKALSKSVVFNIKNQILTNIVINNESKRIELLLFDLFEVNEPEYLYIYTNLLKLLEVNAFSSGILKRTITIEQLVTIFKNIKLRIGEQIGNRILELKPIPYKNMKLKEIESILSQERLQLKELNKEKNELNSVNSNGIFILYWKPPKKILSNQELNKWGVLSQEASTKINGIVSADKDIIGPKMEYSKIVEQNIHKLVKYKKALMDKYKIKYSNESSLLDNLIKKTEDKIRRLQEQRVTKIKLIYKVRNLIITNQGKVTKRENTREYYPSTLVNIDIIFEFVSAYKRHLIVEYLKGEKVPVNNLINLFELYDLNILYLRLSKINSDSYNKISYKLGVQINNVLKSITLKPDHEYVIIAIDNIYKALGIPVESLDVPKKLEILIEKWPSEYPGRTGIVDSYSQDLFKKLLKVSSPFSFYSEFVQREYLGILSNLPVYKKIENKSEMVLFDPTTGNIGKKAYNGYLFKAYRLNKDTNTGNPVIIHTTREEENPRTGLYVRVPVVYEQPGNYYFIKVPIINPINPNDSFRWKEVPEGAVMLLPDNYDSCSRFDNDEPGCNISTGLANSKCMYSIETKLCKADYSNSSSSFGTPTGLSRWFKEKWVNVCKKEGNKYAKCGKIGKKYPYCRPSVRISLKTPKTVREIGEKKLAKMCKRKKNSNKVRIN